MKPSAEPTSKAPNQRARISVLLRQRGPRGITNLELARLCLRYGARLFELRPQGYEIRTVREDESCFWFILEAELAQPRPLHQPRPPQLGLFQRGSG